MTLIIGGDLRAFEGAGDVWSIAESRFRAWAPNPGAEPATNAAPVFAKFVEAEVKKWLDLGKAANIKLN